MALCGGSLAHWTRLFLHRRPPACFGIPRRWNSAVHAATRTHGPVPKWLKQYKLKQEEKEAPAAVLDKPVILKKRNAAEVQRPRSNSKPSSKAAAAAAAPPPPPARVSVKDSMPTPEYLPFTGSMFVSLNLSEALTRRLHEENYKTPTGIQASAIPVLLQGQDAAIQSYTGSGKTLAYLLPILSTVGPLRTGAESEENGRGGVEAVIVTPSRELGMQIVREAEKILGPDHRKLVQQMIGGANMKRQEEALKKNKPFMVVGTPGRISELSRQGKLHTHGCRFLVLDESDQLLSMKYRTDMKRIMEHVGFQRSSSSGEAAKSEKKRVARQTILVSATMPPAVLKAAQEWGHKPRLIKPTSNEDVTERRPQEGAEAEDVRGARESLPPNLTHYYVVSPSRHRVDTLRRCIHALDAQTVLVFMNFTHRLKDAVFKLEAKGTPVGYLHGEQGKLERANVLSAFRNQKLRVLVTSEVAARGLDVPECDLVVNLELPTDGTHYAHRAGRTGRLGREGRIVSICEQQDEFVLKKFERQLGISIAKCDVSHGVLSLFQEIAAVNRRD